MTPILRLEELRKNYGALRVTDGVSLEVFPGECHALIGPNGAGKTTLIHQISGGLVSDSGRVMFDGHDITKLSLPQRSAAGLGRTFQITALIPQFSVLENVALSAQAKDGSSFRFFRSASAETALNAQAMQALADFGLYDQAANLAGELSHGEQRQLELAMAIVAAPKILLLDEPMAGIGKGESMALTDTLNGLKQSTPMLLIEHDMDAVFKLADRVSVLVYGQIIATGTPEEMRQNAEARAAYLGQEAL
jgi:branched-chain amino acid transport system ATP-binding protein